MTTEWDPQDSPCRSQSVRIVCDGSRPLSTQRLERTKARLIEASLLAAEVCISFDFVVRLIEELLRHRKEDAILTDEIERILDEVDAECGPCDVSQGQRLQAEDY